MCFKYTKNVLNVLNKHLLIIESKDIMLGLDLYLLSVSSLSKYLIVLLHIGP